MITSFIAENYRSIDGEIKLSFMADTGIKDMDNEGYTTVVELTPAVSQMCSRLLV